jgi:hypothetical protein
MVVVSLIEDNEIGGKSADYSQPGKRASTSE